MEIPSHRCEDIVIAEIIEKNRTAKLYTALLNDIHINLMSTNLHECQSNNSLTIKKKSGNYIFL